MTAAFIDDAGTKPGAETIDLQEGNPTGVLLLHGFGDTPQTLGLLAQRLHDSGFDVRAPLLPGHGTSVAQFVHSRRDEWLACARQELAQMRASHERVAVAGLSMGGALAAILASENREITSLALISAYLDMPLTVRIAAASYWIWDIAAQPRKSSNPRSILNPEERAKNLGYGVYSGRLLYELWRLAAQARHALSRVAVPTIILQSRADPRIAPTVAEHAFKTLSAKEKKLVWVEGGGHIITVDYGREKVFDEVTSWIALHQG